MALLLDTETPLWRWTIREELRDLGLMGEDRWNRQFKVRMESEAANFDREMSFLEGQETEAELNRRRRNNLRRTIMQYDLRAFILCLFRRQLAH